MIAIKPKHCVRWLVCTYIVQAAGWFAVWHQLSSRIVLIHLPLYMSIPHIFSFSTLWKKSTEQSEINRAKESLFIKNEFNLNSSKSTDISHFISMPKMLWESRYVTKHTWWNDRFSHFRSRLTAKYVTLPKKLCSTSIWLCQGTWLP